MKILLKEQQLCVTNDGKIISCFKFQRTSCECDIIYAGFFKLALQNSKIEAIETFQHYFLYTGHADDTNFANR